MMIVSCYKPRLMHCAVGYTGDLVYTFKGNAEWIDVNSLGSPDDLADPAKAGYDFIVPCGRCLGCRIDYSHSWADRMAVELQDSPRAIFVTLTYNNAHLSLAANGRPEVSVRDCQLFFKRLRKAYPDTRIRYYLAAEYGPKTHRPHYHAIIYGLGLSDFCDLRSFGYNELKQVYYTSPSLESIWKNGFVQLSEVNYKTCAYVSRYVLKKHYGDDDVWKKLGVAREFNLSSRKPGIGMLHADDFVFSGNDIFTLSTSDGVHQFRLPKCFIRSVKNKRIKDGLPVDFLEEMCFNRRKASLDALKSSVLASEKSYYDFLKSGNDSLSKKLKLLPERM